MRRYLAIIVCLLGLWQVSAGLWIHAKAQLAQILIESAWNKTLVDQHAHKPWPWADTWPVARMHTADEELYILEGAQGNSLAFGPGHLQGSVLPGKKGISIIGGHRDTHFRFLEHIERGQVIDIEHKQGASRYLVNQVSIRDSESEPLSFEDNADQLVLITCYPFETLTAAGHLRYVVTATRTQEAPEIMLANGDSGTWGTL